MTTPEESAPKTHDTDQVLADSTPADPKKKPDNRTQMAQELEEAMSEAGVSREDLTSE
ncbi:hypothetical protein [Actinomadura hibisca]|uniref:hypothetical protein n=1 Tax=Actinomadura hibisca TaxID=68565 RepID=UPI000A406CC5|nr:hypothetical protein [Actinomadura hibisca]